jgi:uncharacterized membrane protein
MIPDPLHPAIVHFPIVFAVLTPLLALAVALGIGRGHVSPRTWLAVVVLQAMLVASAWLAVETGEREEDRVERVVAESHIEEHEESAERFLLLAGLVLPLAAVGLLRGRTGTTARFLTVAASLAVLGAAGLTGHAGGELVYRHGASLAYVDPDATARAAALGAARYESHEEEEDDDD